MASVIDLEQKLRLTALSLESGKFLLEQLNNIKKDSWCFPLCIS